MAETVLVVDGEPHIRRALANALAEDFERVVQAAMAQEAVDPAAAHRPDLIILDLALP